MALEGFGDGLISLGLAGKYFISAEFLDLARLTPRLTSLEYDVGPGIPLLNGHPTLESLVLHCPAPAIPGTDVHAKLCVLLDIFVTIVQNGKTPFCGRHNLPRTMNIDEERRKSRLRTQKAALKAKRAAALAARQVQHRSKKQEAMIWRIAEKACGSGSIAQPTTGAAAETQITLPVVNSKTNLVIVLRQLWVELWSKEEEPEWEIFFKERFQARISCTQVLDWAGFKAEVWSEGIKLQNTIRLGEVLQKEALDRTYTASGKALSHVVLFTSSLLSSTLSYSCAWSPSLFHDDEGAGELCVGHDEHSTPCDHVQPSAALYHLLADEISYGVRCKFGKRAKVRESSTSVMMNMLVAE
ncbi:hypothetical protein M422DRAFT_269000 [Sphaerobolus stellatus SS14]|uniref:Uncharacterized protein n=1 Tax=Sphaerobolus stellatus (strain SS14) TaxID=990650 RepID=A0A0C9UWM7_SPHS4|nr:hypothetical protein M422DRAFT_269000 [Sphaerobolus stellatus SS14]